MSGIGTKAPSMITQSTTTATLRVGHFCVIIADKSTASIAAPSGALVGGVPAPCNRNRNGQDAAFPRWQAGKHHKNRSHAARTEHSDRGQMICDKHHVTQDEARQATWEPPYRCLIPPPLARALKHPLLMPYNRLVVLVLAANLALAYAARRTWWSGHTINLHAISHFALANLTLAILMRQQLVINLLFWLATRAPTTWPLRIRSTLGKVYHFGGLHVGAAIWARCGSSPWQGPRPIRPPSSITLYRPPTSRSP